MSSAALSEGDRLYELIRQSQADVIAIARNTGFTEASIRKIKSHLFTDAHLLDRYVDYGVPATYARFDPDSNIAASWRRLAEGRWTLPDVALLRHEMAETCYMRNVERSYRAAHNAAQMLYPAPEW